MFLTGQLLGLLVVLAGCHQLKEKRVELAGLKTDSGVTSRKLFKAFQPRIHQSIYVDLAMGRVGRSVAREERGLFQEAIDKAGELGVSTALLDQVRGVLMPPFP